MLRSTRVNYWTGEEGREFERDFADWCGSRHAVAVSNGTVALDLALRALEIGPGDEVVVTPRSFLASASCVVTAGATPVFADVDHDSGNITPASIEEACTPRTRAVICVHLGGWPCDMELIMALAERRGLEVIEDCAQAHGARYRGHSVGTFGRVGAWSFCQDKIITTGGEGGMVTTDDDALWSAMWSYKDHGRSWEAVYEREHPPGFAWLCESFGTNWRMTEMQAAIGRIQLRRMPGMVDRRTSIAHRIAEAGRPFECLRTPLPPEGFTHAFYRHTAFVRPEALRTGWDRDRIIAEITARGVPCPQGACPEVYMEKAFECTGFRPSERLPIARELGETSITFLVHPTLTDAEVEKTCTVLSEVLQQASQ